MPYVIAWHQVPFILPAWLNLNPSISNYFHYEVWDTITYSLSIFNGAAIDVKIWEWINDFTHISMGMWLLIQAGIKVNLC